jgi:hypothetical protein
MLENIFTMSKLFFFFFALKVFLIHLQQSTAGLASQNLNASLEIQSLWNFSVFNFILWNLNSYCYCIDPQSGYQHLKFIIWQLLWLHSEWFLLLFLIGIFFPDYDRTACFGVGRGFLCRCLLLELAVETSHALE